MTVAASTPTANKADRDCRVDRDRTGRRKGGHRWSATGIVRGGDKFGQGGLAAGYAVQGRLCPGARQVERRETDVVGHRTQGERVFTRVGAVADQQERNGRIDTGVQQYKDVRQRLVVAQSTSFQRR